MRASERASEKWTNFAAPASMLAVLVVVRDFLCSCYALCVLESEEAEGEKARN